MKHATALAALLLLLLAGCGSDTTTPTMTVDEAQAIVDYQATKQNETTTLLLITAAIGANDGNQTKCDEAAANMARVDYSEADPITAGILDRLADVTAERVERCATPILPENLELLERQTDISYELSALRCEAEAVVAGVDADCAQD